MALAEIGEFRVVLQRYNYASKEVLCITKILPEKVSLFEKEPQDDFNWMTANRWTKIESALCRLFSSITDWHADAHKLKSEMLVDHTKVAVTASEELLPAAQKLLKADSQCQNVVSLQIVLRYMSHEDTSISNNQLSKRKYERKKEEPSSSKPKHAHGATTSGIKKASPRSNHQEKLQRADNKTKANADLIPSVKKKERRSISQGSHSARDTSPIAKVSSLPKKRSKSPTSRSSSVEAKSERRSARSPVKTNRYKEFIMSEKAPRKRKQKVPDNSSEERPDTKKVAEQSVETKANGTTDASRNVKVEQLDGAHMNMEVLKELDKLLTRPKPREVKILLLEDMDETDVMNTFEKYQKDFDKLFKQQQHKDHTTNYMSIDHSHTLDILSKPIRDKMLKKLADVYCKSGPHGSLVINGLLPLWIVRLFMDRFKFTKQEAVEQITDQLNYHTYLRAVNNECIEDY